MSSFFRGTKKTPGPDHQFPGRKKLDSLEYRVERSSARTGLVKPGSRLLVGVSGGPDSMALLSLLSAWRDRWNLELIALYCHHGLRPEADEEEAFVRNWSQHLNCGFSAARLGVGDYRRENKVSLQEAARECRYRAFETQMDRHRADGTVLAHTADDQAEEVLIGLIRGAGLGGLGGIPRQRGRFVRPLLETYREEILAYLSRKGIPYRNDASNHDFRYLRARLRYHLIPELKKYSPNIVNQLNRMAGLLQADEDYLQKEAERAWARMASGDEEQCRLERPGLAGLPPAIGSRLVQRALRQTRGGLKAVSSKHIRAILQRAADPSPGGRLSLPGGRVAVWDPDHFRIRPATPPASPPSGFYYLVERPGTVKIQETGGTLSLKRAGLVSDRADREWFRGEALVDWEKIRWPLVIRSAREGDRFQPLGLQGTKKVTRFLRDRKIPPERRSRIPLICSPDGIVWVAGVEIGQLFALGEGSRTALHLTYRDGEERN